MKTKQEKAKLFAALFPEAATRLIAALTQVQFDQAVDNWFVQANNAQVPQEQIRDYYSKLAAPEGYETSALLDDMFRFDCTPQGGMYWASICVELTREETLSKPTEVEPVEVAPATANLSVEEMEDTFSMLYPEAETKIRTTLGAYEYELYLINLNADPRYIAYCNVPHKQENKILRKAANLPFLLVMEASFYWKATAQGYKYWSALANRQTPPTPAPVPVPRKPEKVEPATIRDLLASRETTHGSYSETALYSQTIKSMVRGSANYNMLSNQQRESLDMIAVKIGRILSGNPDEQDHWKDIAGYATLVIRPVINKEPK